MAEVVLHHYPLSPFSEKIRRVLAYKEIPWRAVEQPIMAPKPDLTPLTGGYRRIPVLQIGADIYCDTALMVRVLERLYPARQTLPPTLAGAASVIEDWADHRLFMQTVPPTVVRLIDQLPPEFFADRAAMTPAFTRESLIASAPHALAQTLISLDRLDRQLQHSPFVLGDAFTVADAACFHPVWFMQHGGDLFSAVRERAGLSAWFDRVTAFGAGKVSALSAADALTIAREATPADIAGGCAAECGFSAGTTVSIVPDDYGLEETVGQIVRVDADELVVLRTDPVVGEVAVHYPRAGYRFKPA
jgi:glutathione S-transferase